MTDHTDTLALIAETLADIAPDADASAVDADLHDGLGLDSMDLLNLVAAIHEKTGLDIPERDYPQVTTLRLLAEYLDARVSPA